MDYIDNIVRNTKSTEVHVGTKYISILFEFQYPSFGRAWAFSSKLVSRASRAYVPAPSFRSSESREYWGWNALLIRDADIG